MWIRKRKLAPLFVFAGIASIVFVTTNPMLVLNLLTQPSVVTDNLGHSAGFYSFSIEGIARAALIFACGATFVATASALVGTIMMRRRDPTKGCVGNGDVAWLLAAPAIVVLIQFILLADGRSTEYARFALLPIALAWIAGVIAIEVVTRNTLLQTSIGLTLLLMMVANAVAITPPGWVARQPEPIEVEGTTIHSKFEPAPWSMPAVDLWAYQIVVVPRNIEPDVTFIYPFNLRGEIDGRILGTPIDWSQNDFRVHHSNTKTTKD